MEKEWYIKIRGKQQGPFAKGELLAVPGISADTLVKKGEWNYWLPLREVEELKDLIEDEKPKKKLVFPEPPRTPLDEVLAAEGGPPNYTLWILIILLLLIIYLISING